MSLDFPTSFDSEFSISLFASLLKILYDLSFFPVSEFKTPSSFWQITHFLMRSFTIFVGVDFGFGIFVGVAGLCQIFDAILSGYSRYGSIEKNSLIMYGRFG